MQQVKQIQKERELQKEMWSYILKKQIAPLRWSLSMWTRYNIAEPSIHKSIETFRSDWGLVIQQLDKIPAKDLSLSLGWDYDEKF